MLDRRPTVAALLEDRQDLLVVCGLGSPVYDVFAAGDHDHNFYLWGAMGGAAMVGLGLALAQPGRPVTVFTGDGEILMGVGGFATIAQHLPDNLTLIVLDNEQYGETGMQTTATGQGTDLAAVARGFGIADSVVIDSDDAIAGLRARMHARTGTHLAVLKIKPGDVPRTTPLRDGVDIKTRFRTALLGPAATA